MYTLLVSKTILFHTIIWTWLVAYIDDTVPYFPIEISRTASGRLCRFVFPFGITIFCISAYYESTYPLSHTLIPIIGLLITSYISDELHWVIHIVGVAVMGLGVTIHVLLCAYMRSDGYEFQLLYLISSSILCTLYISLKVYGVLIHNKLVSLYDAYEQGMDINYNGNGTQIQLKIFKLTGVVQWIIFILLTETY